MELSLGHLRKPRILSSLRCLRNEVDLVLLACEDVVGYAIYILFTVTNVEYFTLSTIFPPFTVAIRLI